MSPLRTVVLSAVFGLFIAACGVPPSGVCAPGRAEGCACANGETGAQTCKPDGSGFEACVCGSGAGGGSATGGGGATGGGATGGGATGGGATGGGATGGGATGGGATGGGATGGGATGGGATGGGATGGGATGGGATGGGATGGGGVVGPAGYTETNMPLELVSPRAVNTGVPAITASHRIFRAFPGLTYDIRAVVVGGAYPYTFALSNAPSGMTIDAASGHIVWANPQANATPTLTVTDSAGASVTSSWTIAVAETGFRFVDAMNGQSTNMGTQTSPWRTLSDVAANGAADQIVYFRAGTYTTAGLTRGGVGGAWERVQFNGNSLPVMWLAYPGERPVLDLGYQAGGPAAPFIRLSYRHPYVDGFEAINSQVMTFQIEAGDYAVLRRNFFHAQFGGVDGTNSAAIMTVTWDPPLYGMAVQDSEFANFGMGNGLKIYGRDKLVIEDNHFHHMPAPMELKAGVSRFTVRHNRFNDISSMAIAGNMHNIGTTITGGEVLFNTVLDSGQYTLDLNQDGLATRINVFRNTFIGRVRVRNTDGADGPFFLNNNVIINGDANLMPQHIHFENVSAPSVVNVGTNLVGTPGAGMVDADGSFTPSFSSNLGTHGAQR